MSPVESIYTSWIVRLCRNQHVIAVDVDAGRGRPLPVETHRIYSSHLFLLGPELERSRCCRRGWGRSCVAVAVWRSCRSWGRRRCWRGCRAGVARSICRRCSKQRSAPDDHFTAGPHCRVIVSGIGRVGGAGGCPTIRAGIVSPAGVQVGSCRCSIRPRRSFHCQSTLPCERLGHRARWWCWWLSNYPCWDCISRRC